MSETNFGYGEGSGYDAYDMYEMNKPYKDCWEAFVDSDLDDLYKFHKDLENLINCYDLIRKLRLDND